MIVKEGGSYAVKSETIGKDGQHKNLGKYKTREEAVKRLGQIEFFKRQK